MFTLPFEIKKSHIASLILLFLIVILVAGLAYYLRMQAYKNSINEANKTLFTDAAAMAFVDMKGDQVTLRSYRGSVLVVNDWASWSPFAVDELPLLEKIGATFADKKVVILAINRKETNDQAQRFLNTLVPLPHVNIIIDTVDYFYGITGGYAMPETLIYSKDGELIEHVRGVLQYDTLATQISHLLEK